MNILIVGSGGREHALCHTFAKSPRISKIFCADGNAGIASVAELVDISPMNIFGLADLAAEKGIGITFVGGESSLALGIVDEFRSRGLNIIGPTASAARLEASKSFAKDFMLRHAIPTAKYKTAGSASEAAGILRSGEFGGEETPVVVKADGLAAGKGVVVAADRAEAIAAIDILAATVGQEAASSIVIEECLFGKEISLLAFCDGTDFALMPATRDHKRIGEGDTGPNTGGMGTITDDKMLSAAELDEITQTIMRPTLAGCEAEGFPFTGILFLGLMMTGDGPKLLEYNVRFGDPETQAILVRLETYLVDICEAMLEHRLSERPISWRSGSSACVVLASEGYPAKPRIGDRIEGLDGAAAADIAIFHAGTKFAETNDAFLTAGGRVLCVTSVAESLETSLACAYKSVSKISWPGIQYRRDIGK